MLKKKRYLTQAEGECGIYLRFFGNLQWTFRTILKHVGGLRIAAYVQGMFDANKWLSQHA